MQTEQARTSTRQEITFIADSGMATQGVRIIKLEDQDRVCSNVSARPKSMTVNGVSARFNHEAAAGLIKVALPKGEGTVVIKSQRST